MADRPIVENGTLSQLVDFESYRQSWVDRVNEAFRSSSVPAPILYLIIGIVAVLIAQGALWLYRIDPPGLFNSVSFAVGIWVSSPLAFVHFLDDLASRAIENFRPALALSEEDFVNLCYLLTTMPTRPVVLMNLATAALTLTANVVFPDIFESVVGEVESTVPILLIPAAALGVSGSLIYHTIRQLAMIRSLYTSASRLTIFDATSTYAFSGLTMSTGLAWAVILYLGVRTVPGILEHPVWTAVSAAILTVIFASIGSVLVMINRRLVDEKNRLSNEVTNRLLSALSQVHERQDQDDLGNFEKQYQLVMTLSHERDMLRKTPTWPWQPGTILAFLSALLLPVTIFLIQEIIRNLAEL